MEALVASTWFGMSSYEISCVSPNHGAVRKRRGDARDSTAEESLGKRVEQETHAAPIMELPRSRARLPSSNRHDRCTH